MSKYRNTPGTVKLHVKHISSLIYRTRGPVTMVKLESKRNTADDSGLISQQEVRVPKILLMRSCEE